MKNYYFIKMGILIPLVIIAFGFTTARGQIGKPVDEKKFSSVPELLRPTFYCRLSLFIELQRSRQWEKIYELSTDSIEDINLTKEKFVKDNEYFDVRPLKLLEFMPTSALLVNEGNG